MRVVIIVFSATGNTYRVGKMLEVALVHKGADVQLINIAKSSQIFKEKQLSKFLEEQIQKHDLICIGSPVYGNRFHYNVKNLIKHLPSPNKHWGNLACSFVTYGGVSSGVALYEATKLLQESGRTPVLAMKINSEHSFTKFSQIEVKINVGMPGEEALEIIDDLATRIVEIGEGKTRYERDLLPVLDYQKAVDKLKISLIFRENLWQKYFYPKIRIDSSKCIKCGTCVEICPVQRIEMTENGATIPHNSPTCTHCLSCITHCPAEAIYTKSNWGLFNTLLKKATKGKGFIYSEEDPKSVIYG